MGGERNRSLRVAAGIVIVSTLASVACASAEKAVEAERSSAPETDSPKVTAGDLLKLVPGDTSFFDFRDWTAFQAWTDTTIEPGDHNAQEAWLTELSDLGLGRPAYEGSSYSGHRDLWGWDLSDMSWEGFVHPGRGGSAHIIGLDDPSHLTDIVARFEERDFDLARVGDIPVYSHEPDLNEPWISDEYGPRAPLSVLNVAVLEPQVALVMSEDIDAVAAVAAAASGKTKTLSVDPHYASAVQLLEDAPSVIAFSVGASRCDNLLPRSLTPGFRRKLLTYAGRPYEVLGLGHLLEEDLKGRLVLTYDDRADASTDLPLRRDVAENGFNISDVDTFREGSFTLSEARVDGSSIVLEVGPADTGELDITGALHQDALYALC